MMRNIIALLLAVMLVGCSSSWVTVSNNENYDYYRNGERVCESSVSCKIHASSGKEMLLEARKDDIVYGHLLVARPDSKHGERAFVALEAAGGTLSFVNKVCDMSSMRSDAVICMMLTGGVIIATPVALLVSMAVPDNLGKIPENLTIPVGERADSLGAFPWDQPAKD